MPCKTPAKEISIAVSVPASIDFGRNILQGVSACCERRGLRLHLLSDTGTIEAAQGIDQDKLPPLAGIVAHISSPEEFAVFRRFSPHVVSTSNRQTVVSESQVINDEAAIGQMGADYLVSLGLRKLVFLNKSNMRYSSERSAAFFEAAKAADTEVECIEFARSNALASIAKTLLHRPFPMGLMAESDNTARAFIESLPDFRKVVPHRIAVLGVDNDSLQNALSPVRLSSIRTGGQEIGVRAAELILRLYQGKAPPSAPLYIRPTRVVERASTNVLAIDDPIVAKAVRLMRDRIGDFRDVKSIVETVGVNRRSLELRFRKTLNRSIAAEMTQARLNTARNLLESTNLSIAEIAELVGYPEYRLLTLAFQRLTGEPPSAYRKRVRGD